MNLKNPGMQTADRLLQQSTIGGRLGSQFMNHSSKAIHHPINHSVSRSNQFWGLLRLLLKPTRRRTSTARTAGP